ncbi:MAG: ribonuclease P protein component [Bacteroidales bacterium]|nr:ribonuclease P protein component [Bacteroidales bacterium]MDD4602231.1 ribonuclease P protein component [Bacteroidales bacterium]
MKQTFSKKERLVRQRLITGLFADGSSFHCSPFRITWQFSPFPIPAPVQILISVPKKNFHHAVHRNLIRRKIREAYRLNKQQLHDSLLGNNRQLLFAVYYTSKEILPFEIIQGKIILLLQRLIEENEKVTG